MNDPTAPPTLVLFLIGVLVMSVFIGLLWAVNTLKGWRHRPKSCPPRHKAAPADQTPTLPSSTTASTATTIASDGHPLPLRVWLDRVNQQPDRVPHIAAKGPSGSGKTTLVLATLADRPGKVLICTPKNAQDDPWGGAPAVRLTADLTFDQIEAALGAVYEEVKRRNVAGYDDWLTLVVDDYPWVAQECPSAAKVVTMIGNMGHSVRVRLILLAQTTTVKSWGFEGNGEARSNFVFIDLQEDHSAVIYRGSKEPEPIDTARRRACSADHSTATLEGDDAKLWRQRYPGRSLPRRKAASIKEALKLQRQLGDDLKTGRDPQAENPKVTD